MNNKQHSFHIPVLGIGFSIDTPVKVAWLGIDSVISLADDILLEKLRKMYCNRFNLPYREITTYEKDYRARRITEYLNLINKLVIKRFEEWVEKASGKISELKQYFRLLPDSNMLKQEFLATFCQGNLFTVDRQALKSWLRGRVQPGSIDVNIMTKLDKPNYRKGRKLPVEYNDAHAALRGYALSELGNSSLILSAGMNPQLYGYLNRFADFLPDEAGTIRKKITLKVSDYRSAYIQGRFLAQRGIWVSEYRIESGLNCGGHAFATNGHLMGPILADFRDKRQELIETTYGLLRNYWREQGKPLPDTPLPIRITAQGGVGTAEEHRFLLEHYKLDSVGWGTPFLLVSEATNVDVFTRQLLMAASEKNLYTSRVSPLGVLFNNLRNSTKDQEKEWRIKQGKPGSPCPKKYLANNLEFTSKPICTASRQYQQLKLKQIEQSGLSGKDKQNARQQVLEKTCICTGLGTAALLVNNLDTRAEGKNVAVCPGPNMAYFNKELTLREMIEHIYGKRNVISHPSRPHMFVKELSLYVEHLRTQVEETLDNLNVKQSKLLVKFIDNLHSGIEYYHQLFSSSLSVKYFHKNAAKTKEKLDHYGRQLVSFKQKLACL